MSEVEFQFVPPPNAPVFKPTWEEFQDALGYIDKIRPIAEQTGICKIVPPPDWQPPFAVDVDNFKFTPRIQRLNELEAHTRIKLNFLDQIAKFWELQGSSLKIPVIERRALDLYSLHHHVQAEGGFETVNREKKWPKVQSRLGYPNQKNLITLLKNHYERIVHPFHIFNTEKNTCLKREVHKHGTKDIMDKDYKPHKIPSRMNGKIPEKEKNGRRSKRYPENIVDLSDGEDDGNMGSKELKRLQCYGAGPKMAGFDTEGPLDEKGKTRGKKFDYFDYDPLEKYVCLNCGRGDAEDQMLLCDGCDDSYHTFCLVPQLPEIPKGDWRCPKCIALEVSKPVQAFGFEQAQKEYSLQSFGEMADKFKQDYFNMPVHKVPIEMAEQEFWRIVSSIDEDVIVEYGADLHTMDHGSGFPTKSSKNLLPADQEYATSSWNLNNIPVVEGSVLGHINCDISGMKVPWMYVGMCFSTFCWHNEDHWSYSINYLHWGETKLWYGVPGSLAEKFEKAMGAAAPELFEAQPDLLHQLVTIMNPNIIMKAGIPIFRMVQNAGEFVITFPRSYHAGFNQGYNFAEAVNFCPADWLTIGRECILHYSNLKRYCVFSHDELVCKMASTPDRLDLTCAAATYTDLLILVDIEKKFRRELLQHGVTNAERVPFELLPDDERQCDFCKTTCFMSSVVCTCSSDKLVCLRHYKQLCDCSGTNKTLRYRYTMDEMPPMLFKLKQRAESFDVWALKVKNALEAKKDKLELHELRDLVSEAETLKFPDSEFLQALLQAVTEAEKCSTVATHLAAKKVRTRNRGSNIGTDNSKAKLTLEELELFNEQIESLACNIKEAESVKELLDSVKDYRIEVKHALEKLEKLEISENCDEIDSEKLESLMEAGFSFDIDMPELTQLKTRAQQYSWIEKVEESLEDPDTLTLEDIKKFLDAQVTLPPSKKLEDMTVELQEIQFKMGVWEAKAKKSLSQGMTILEAEELLNDSEGVKGYLPSMASLKDGLKKTKDWLMRIEDFESSEHPPILEVIESLVSKGRTLPFNLDQVVNLEENLKNAHAWLDKTARIFTKKTSNLSLLEVLLPRTDIGIVAVKRKKFKKDSLSSPEQLAQLLDISADEVVDPKTIVSAYKISEEREVKAMRAIRAHNRNKSKFDDLSTFCVCHRSSSGTMFICTLCANQFHLSCIPVHHKNKLKANSDGRFICVSCERSKRPRLDTILTLLVALQKIPIRMPEAEALQSLTDRVISWQEKAKALLYNEEMVVALSKINGVSQKLMIAKAKDDEPIIVNVGLDPEESNYNILVKTLLGNGGCLVNLSPAIKQQVQELLVEGELLEVTTDECSNLWRVLQASSCPASQLEGILVGMNTSPQPEKVVRQRQSSESLMSKTVAKKPKQKPAPKRKLTKQTLTQAPQNKRKKSLSTNKKDVDIETFSDNSEFSDDEEECAAPSCVRPFGSNVQWVQCDGCDLWFHYVCVGLCQKDVTEDTEYLCRACKLTK